LQKQIDQHAAELERTVAERTRELTEANAALDTFSYSVSHDLRAPLRTMQGFTEALLEDHADQLDPVGQDYARRVAQAAQRLDHLIQDLLRYSRLSQSKIDLQAVDLSRIVKEILPDFTADLERQRGEVIIEEPLPPVLGHPATLSQVMANLINNALKFVSLGKKPEVRVRADDSTNGTVRIWIEDNGIGIDPNHQDRIFQIFERLHTSYPGTGTGLAIVRKGVERMGGQVGVISQPGSGSRFWVDLPTPATV
jgi:signal transduction histidine kinase